MMAKDAIGLERWRARQAQGEPDGRLIGVGLASYCEQSAHGTGVFAAWGLPLVPGYDQATARITPDGGLEIRAGVHSHGQGMETTLAQVACEVLGLDLGKVRVVLGDTALTPYSTGTYASRSIVMTGGAVSNACNALVPRLLNIGAHLMQCASNDVRLEAGHVVGPRQSVSLMEIAHAWYKRPERLPPDVDLNGLEATVGYKPKIDTGVFSYASHAAVVAVDTEIGQVEILDYVIVEDCGTMVNPMVVEGQTIGGAVQGVGTALYEESPYDNDTKSGTLALSRRLSLTTAVSLNASAQRYEYTDRTFNSNYDIQQFYAQYTTGGRRTQLAHASPQVVQQLQAAGVGPVHVVDEDHERTLTSEVFEELPQTPCQLTDGEGDIVQAEQGFETHEHLVTADRHVNQH